MSSVFERYSKLYIEAGYSPIPIAPGQKRPGYNFRGYPEPFGRWQRFCDAPVGEDDLAEWTREGTSAGIGIALGYNNVVAIDIDIEDHPVRDAIDAIMPASQWVKRGAKGYTAFFRTEERIKAQKFKVLFTPEGELDLSGENGGKPKSVLEILAYGNQTVIAPTIHPDGMPYQWEDEPLSMCPAQSLPLLPADFQDDVEEALKPFGHVRRAAEYHAGEWDTEFDSYYRDKNNQALANLDMWVPFLDRVDIDPSHNGAGYHIVATWRGGDGYNIGIHQEGIQDFTGKDGNNGGMTAIDLVVLMNDMTPGEAFMWLTDKLEPGWREEADRIAEGFIRSTAKNEAEATRTHEERMRKLDAIQREEELKAEADALDDYDRNLISEDAREIIKSREKFAINPGSLDEIIENHSTGLMRKIIDYVRDMSETPSTAISTVVALGLMSLVFNRRWALVQGDRKTFAGIYAFGTAPSGIGKTSAVQIANKIYNDAVYAAVGDDVTSRYAANFSEEDTGQDEGADKDGSFALDSILGGFYQKDIHAPATIINQLNKCPNTLMVVDECANFVRRVWSDNGGDSAIGLQAAVKSLISAGNGTANGTDYTDAKKNQSSVENPGFSLIGFSTPKSLMNALPLQAYEDGTIGRFLWLGEPGYPDLREVTKDEPARKEIVDIITGIIASRVESAMDITFGGYLAPDVRVDPLPVQMTEEAKMTLWQARLEFHEEGRKAHNVDREDAALWNRVVELAVRVALLHSLGRHVRDATITKEDISLGMRLAIYSIERWAGQAGVAAGRSISGAVETEARRTRLISLLADAGGVMTRGLLCRKMNMKKLEVEGLIDELVEIGSIYVTPGKRSDTLNVHLT